MSKRRRIEPNDRVASADGKLLGTAYHRPEKYCDEVWVVWDDGRFTREHERTLRRVRVAEAGHDKQGGGA